MIPFVVVMIHSCQKQSAHSTAGTSSAVKASFSSVFSGRLGEPIADFEAVEDSLSFSTFVIFFFFVGVLFLGFGDTIVVAAAAKLMVASESDARRCILVISNASDANLTISFF